MEESLPAVPLRWPFDWDNLTTWRTVLSGFPLVGPQAEARRDLVRQLRLRTVGLDKHWSEFSPSELELARVLSKIAKRGMGWPNDHFIPQDPFGIVFWDSHDGMGAVEAVTEVEQTLGLERKPEAEWESLFKKSFGEVIRILSREAAAVAR